MAIPTDDALTTILREAKAIALTIHSPNPDRPSYQIAQYLRTLGYQVYPIHPAVKEIDGHRCYASLAEVPGPVDIVNVFRRAEALPGIVQEVLDLQASYGAGVKAPTLWAQLGVTHPEAETIASAAQLNLVMDRCIKIEHQRLIG